MNRIPVYRSKTFGVALLNLAALKVFPNMKEWVINNPDAYVEILTVVIIALRGITEKAIEWNFWRKKR